MNTRHAAILAACALLSACCAVSLAAPATQGKAKDAKKDEIAIPPYKGPKKRIAVMPIETNAIDQGTFSEWSRTYKAERGITTLSDVGLRMTEMLTTALDSTGRFILLERAAIGDIKNEMAITEELGNAQTQVKKGSVMGAQMLIRAAVTEFAPNKKKGGGGISLGNVVLGGAKAEAGVTIDLRFIDPVTSQIKFTAKAEGTSKSGGGIVGFKVGSLSTLGGGSSEEPIETATRNAIAKAVQLVVDKMGGLPWEARIAQVNAEGLLVINRGTNDGLVVGDRLKVYKPGETITDPETGEVLGRDEDKEVGEASITWVGERLARAAFTGEGKPEKNYILKLFAPAPKP